MQSGRQMTGRFLTVGVLLLLMLAFLCTAAPAKTFAASRLPGQPKITKAAVYQNNNVSLQWTKAKQAVKYKVYRKKAGGKYILVKTTTKRSYYSRNLSYGSQYTYKVKAVNKAGKTKTSKSKRVYTKPAKPHLTAKLYGTNRVKLSWKTVKGAVKYKVYRKKGSGKFVLLKTTTKRSLLHKNLAYNTRYAYKVVAVSKAGRTTVSSVKTVKTGKRPAAEVPGAPEIPQQPVVPDRPQEPEAPSNPPLPDMPEQPEMPDEPEVPVFPDIPEVPQEPEAPSLPEAVHITIKIPIYTEETVYWIKDIKTGEVLYETTEPAAFEVELLSRPNPETWHWGSGGVKILKGYETLTMTEAEWEGSWYNGQPDVIVVKKERSV